MFYVFCLFTPLYRRFRLSRGWHGQECEEIYRLVSKILNFMACGSVFDRFCVPSKVLDFAVLERGGGCCRQGTSQQPTPRSRFTDFPGARGGLLTCRLAPNVRQAIACGVELGGISTKLCDAPRTFFEHFCDILRRRTKMLVLLQHF